MLWYIYLKLDSTHHVIINTYLNVKSEDKLVWLLKEHRKIIIYNFHNLKGIGLSKFVHQIHMLDNQKPSIENQIKLNPNMKEVARKEVIKLLMLR